jgi:hypothetical protein
VRKIFGLTGAEVRGYWRKLPSKELFEALTKYYSADHIEED